VLDEAGFDGAGLIEASKQNKNGCKDILKKNVEDAAAAQIFGVPTYQVDDGYPIWGQDRAHVVQDLLAGWSIEGEPKPRL